MAPSIRLKMMRPPSAGSIFFSSVAASNGMYLYMKMKNASEMTILTAASQLLMVAAFSPDLDLEESAALGDDGTANATGVFSLPSPMISSMATFAEKRSAR